MTDADMPAEGPDEAGLPASPDSTHVGVRLPSGRRASPWSTRLLLISLFATLLLAPLWLDPVTLGQLRGASPSPTAGASPAPTASASPAADRRGSQ